MNYKTEIEWIDGCIEAQYLAIEKINDSIDILLDKKGGIIAKALLEKVKEKVGV